MTTNQIAHQRLHNQHIAGPGFSTPADVVRWLGAVQAQDYPAGKWAVGLRAPSLSDDEVERAITNGEVLRTHVMRPTWHLVAPEDIRWLQALTAPRVKVAISNWARRMELDEAFLARTHILIEQALQGGNHLTRPEIAAVLNQAGIPTDPLRLTNIVMQAELDALICSGPRKGHEITYALLEERVPQTRPLAYDEALAELTRRYFTSHGPATVKDFVWWSGLTTAQARSGLEMIKTQLIQEVFDGKTYWFPEPAPSTGDTSSSAGAPGAYLLPNYDEYIVAYADRTAAYDDIPADKLDARGNVLFNHTILINGWVVGIWKRTLKKAEVVIEATPFASLSESESQVVTAAAERYGRFLHLPATVKL
ncbi:MAG: winged helix DNA-binding domain-containing protein [Chloroflexia bacterium]